jgi:hypothetical protein
MAISRLKITRFAIIILPTDRFSPQNDFFLAFNSRKRNISPKQITADKKTSQSRKKRLPQHSFLACPTTDCLSICETMLFPLI